MNAQTIKEKAKALGVDLVGIASPARLASMPHDDNPLRFMPNAKSVVVLGHRILRGSMRGVEEGTNFSSTYFFFGMEWPELEFLAKNVYEMTVFLEENGFEAMPLVAHSVNGGRVMDFKIDPVAEAAGLGSVGKGGFFLTKEYGHRQRFALILTDAELEADAPCPIDLCNGCDACIKACPLGAFAKNNDGSYSLNKTICATCKNGAITYAAYKETDRFAAVCGRTCLSVLEGKIGQSFKNPFRKRKVWRIDANGDSSLIDKKALEAKE